MRNPLFTQPSSGQQTARASTKTLPPWKILIVDDELEVHRVTKMALRQFVFDERDLFFIDATSAKEAQEILEETPDIAIALIDVVMETDHAGLELVNYIRLNLKNSSTRIILRTGQPGQAPEEQVIRDYDINDYKEKTDLTIQKLHTLFYATLRSYRDIVLIEEQKRGLRKVVESSVEVLRSSTLTKFASSVLEQLLLLFDLHKSAIYCTTVGLDKGNSEKKAIAATGNFASCVSVEGDTTFPNLVTGRMREVMLCKKSVRYDDAYVVYTASESGYENMLYLEVEKDVTGFQQELLELYCTNVAIIYENLLLNEEIKDTQSEIVYLLADAVEHRSKETGAHVKRVSLISEKLARYVGLGDYEVEQVKNASPLHDLGKIAIPDQILHKPGGFDSAERESMNSHAEIGSNILAKSHTKLLNTAASIALTHHEHWDGSGYPHGIGGEDIPIYGRITALADVFDALGAERCYKEAWSDNDVREYLVSKSGSQFDPNLVDILLSRFDEFQNIRQQFPD